MYHYCNREGAKRGASFSPPQRALSLANGDEEPRCLALDDLLLLLLLLLLGLLSLLFFTVQVVYPFVQIVDCR